MVFGKRRPLIIPPNVTDPRLKTSWFQPSNEIIKQQEEILANSYFLILQGDEFGERLRCSRCNNRHNYITLMCVNRPVSGLFNGLYAYWHALTESGRLDSMTDAQRSRYEEITAILEGIPDLSKVHPAMARKVVRDIGPADMVLGAVSIGVLEPISHVEAKRLEQKINEKGIKPRFSLQPLKQYEQARALEYTKPGFTRDRWRG